MPRTKEEVLAYFQKIDTLRKPVVQGMLQGVHTTIQVGVRLIYTKRQS